MQKPPRVIFYDIESAPSKGWYYDLYKEGNIIKTIDDWFLLSFAYKIQGQKKIHYHCLADYPGYSKNKTNDKALATDLHRLVFCSADILIGHNIDRFDNRKSKARFIAHGLPPTPPVKTIDTLKLARRIFKFDSNRLAALGEYLGLGGKTVTTGWKMWEACIEGDRDAWAMNGRYNRRDCALTEAVYNKLAPWHPNPPAMTFSGDCPSCRSSHVTQRGFNVSKTRRTKRLQCQSCGHWFSGPASP